MLQHDRGELSVLVAGQSEPAIGGAPFEWLDANLRLRPPERREPYSVEWRGVDFLAQEHRKVVTAYRRFWLHTGNAPTWDAVGVRTTDRGQEWLLIEAKAHIGELRQSCSARPRAEGGSREAIEEQIFARNVISPRTVKALVYRTVDDFGKRSLSTPQLAMAASRIRISRASGFCCSLSSSPARRSSPRKGR